MNVTIKTTKSFCVEMTEDQARDLLRVATNDGSMTVSNHKSETETFNALRQVLLSAGVYLTDEKNT